MIYLNRDRKTKEFKPTDGLKSRVPNQKWRIYELNEKIKPFTLRLIFLFVKFPWPINQLINF